MKESDNFLKGVNPSILLKARRVHFVGIGGIGVSAIARMVLTRGKKISGSDRESSAITQDLKKHGAKIFFGHNAKNVSNDIDLVIYTPAVDFENPELKKAKQTDIPCLSYPETLGMISKDKYTIAISGAHGKTTTTAMIGQILMDAKLEPTIIVGSLLKDQKSNFVAGKGKYFICEACEYKKSFLNLSPRIIVITNIDNDHLDYYKNLNNIKKAFAKFASKLDKNDFLVCDKNNKNLRLVVKKTKCKIIDYSKVKTGGLKLKIPGGHNIKNAQAALAAARILKISPLASLKALNNFTGTRRRFEYKGKTKNGVLVYDDYAHHPAEIKATLKAAKEFFRDKKIWCVFQPHLYSRTKNHLFEFDRSFKDAAIVIIAPIYAAREENNPSINSQMLAKEIEKNNKQVIYFEHFSKIEKYITAHSDKNSVIITMGAGDIYKISDNLVISKS